MKDFLSLVVVTVFMAIVFRRRLAPFFKSRKERAGKQVSVNALPDKTWLPPVASGSVCYDVLAFDYEELNRDGWLLGKEISVRLKNRLDFLGMHGTILKIDFIPVVYTLTVIISWEPLSGGKEAGNG